MCSRCCFSAPQTISVNLLLQISRFHPNLLSCSLFKSSIFHPNRLSQLKGHLLLMIIIPKQCNFSPRFLMYMYNLLFTCLITKACPFQMTPTWLSISSYVHLYSPTLLPSNHNKKLNLAINFLILGLLRSVLSLQTLKVVWLKTCNSLYPLNAFRVHSSSVIVRGEPPNRAPASAPLLAAAPEPQRCRRGREVINNPGRGAETAGRCTVWPDKYSLENHQRARAHP